MSIQVENGNFARIHNEISERLARTDLSGSEFRCLWFLLRKTYGFQRKEDHISYSQFAEGTGLDRRNVIRSLDKMAKRNIIYCHDNGNNRPQTWGFNKYFEQWDKTSGQNDTSSKSVSSGQNDTSLHETSGQTTTTSSGQNVTTSSVILTTHNRYKDIKDKQPSAQHFAQPQTTIASQDPNPTKLILDAYIEVHGKEGINYPKEGTFAKKIAADGGTPELVKGCYAWMKLDKFWAEKRLGLSTIHENLPEYKNYLSRTAATATPSTGVNWQNYGGPMPDYIREMMQS
jgi:phage replication O-like protein O